MGVYSFVHINVEAYPDPAPALIEVVAQWPGHPPRKWNARSRFRWKSLWPACRASKRRTAVLCSVLSHLRKSFEYEP